MAQSQTFYRLGVADSHCDIRFSLEVSVQDEIVQRGELAKYCALPVSAVVAGKLADKLHGLPDSFDLVGLDDFSNFAISERSLSLLQNSGLTGWGSYELELSLPVVPPVRPSHSHSGTEDIEEESLESMETTPAASPALPRYFGLQVFGDCGAIETPKKLGFIKGYEFDHSTWDGKDFFSPKDTSSIFVNINASQKNHLNSVNL